MTCKFPKMSPPCWSRHLKPHVAQRLFCQTQSCPWRLRLVRLEATLVAGRIQPGVTCGMVGAVTDLLGISLSLSFSPPSEPLFGVGSKGGIGGWP